MVLRHREGRKHTNADALSRITAEEGHCSAFERGVRPEDLPCRGCKYCVRADQNWGAFTEAVDDAVPLVSQGVRNPVSGDGHTTDATREWGTRGGVGSGTSKLMRELQKTRWVKLARQFKPWE